MGAKGQLNSEQRGQAGVRSAEENAETHVPSAGSRAAGVLWRAFANCNRAGVSVSGWQFACRTCRTSGTVGARKTAMRPPARSEERSSRMRSVAIRVLPVPVGGTGRY